MSEVIIILFNSLSQQFKTFLMDGMWCFFGKDVEKRILLEKLFGEDKRFFIKDRFQKVVEELRQPFLDFVASVSKTQKKQVIWWAADFPSKSPFLHDFFLLLCYYKTIKKIIEFNKEQKIYIFVEDVWLFEMLKKEFQNIKFFGNYKKAKILQILSFLFRGVKVRLWAIIKWYPPRKFFTYIYHKKQTPDSVKKFKRVVGIMPYPNPNAFRDSKYFDPYFTKLFDILENNNIKYFFIYPFYFDISISRNIGKMKELFWPLILELNIFNLITSILKIWNPYIKNYNFQDTSLYLLFQREKLETFSKPGFNFAIMSYKAFKKLIKRNWCHTILYAYENQPWQKMLCLAAKNNKVKIVAYQHSTVPRFYLTHFLGKDEIKFSPLPDIIITTGKDSVNKYLSCGIPEERLKVGGGFRYLYMFEEKMDIKENSNKINILIALPIDLFIAKTMLITLSKIFSHKDFHKAKYLLLIKEHPYSKVRNLPSFFENLNIKIDESPIGELIKSSQVIIYSSSTTGAEALYFNKKTISYIPECLISSDPLDDINHPLIYNLYDGDNPKNILKFIDSKISKDASQFKDLFFSKINEKVWVEELQKNEFI